MPDTRAVARLVNEGLVGVRKLPGVRARYRRADCEALARLALVPDELDGETRKKGA